MAKQEIVNLVIEGQITATSNKINEKFKSEVKSKTAYVKVDKANADLLEDFGLQKYTSKEDKEDFFIIKLTQNVRVYRPNGQVEILSGEAVDTNPNFETGLVKMNIIQGENMGQTFHRIQALLINSSDDIRELAPENPFASFMDGGVNIEGFTPTSSDDIPF